MRYYEDVELNEVRISASHSVTADEIIDFARQWDPQPFHVDEEEAKNWPLGFCASSLHTMAIGVRLTNDANNTSHAVVGGLGWDEVRLHIPVRPRDVLHVRSYACSKRESSSKPDKGIVQSAFEVINQDDKVVMSYKIASMMFKRPAG